METNGEGNSLPPAAILLSAFNVGALTGTSGLLFGGVTGLIHSSRPGIFAAVSAMQWFALGFTYWGGRGLILNYPGNEKVSAKDKIYASSIAGGFAGGSVGGLTRGRTNLVPGAIMFSIFGLLGQSIYNTLDAQHTEKAELAATGKQIPKKSIWHKFADLKWSPMKVLSDQEYENMLKENLLKVDAQIAIIDEDIQKLKEERVKQSTSIQSEN